MFESNNCYATTMFFWKHFFHLEHLAGLVIIILVNNASAIEFPNGVTGTPKVECQVDSVKLTIETSSGNPSHMFVKGRHHEPACVTRNNNGILVKHETCGLVRERSLNPAGVYYKVCIIVQLHPQFITKVDRTFCASCFYMESVKELTNELGVSVMSSTEVAVSFPMPICSYTIRRGSPSGPEIRYATVGEPVFHVWSCPSDSYGMLVQNCYVDDGQGNRILIIDQNGCGIDRYIIQTPSYNDQINIASQESHVFKFADKTITRFTCQIKICIKAGNGCQGISPPANCPAIGGGSSSGGQPPSIHPSQPAINPPASAQQPTSVPRPGTNGAGAAQPSSYRPSFAGKSKNHNRFRSVRDVPEADDDVRYSNNTVDGAHAEFLVDNDFIDVVGELFVLEDVGQTTDRRLYEELLNGMATGTFKKQMRPENSICVPTIGFAAMVLLFITLLIGTLLAVGFLLMKNRRKRTNGKKIPK